MADDIRETRTNERPDIPDVVDVETEPATADPDSANSPPVTTSGPSAFTATGQPSSRSRRWPTVLVSLLALATVAGTGYVAWANYQTGERWRARAAAAERDVGRLESANGQLQSDLDDTKDALDRSEADVAAFERRVGRLANEKARVEDEREQVTAMAERITEIAVAYDEVAQRFQECRGDQATLTDMVFDIEDYIYAGQSYLVYSQINAAAESCGTAEARLADLRRYVQALTGG